VTEEREVMTGCGSLHTLDHAIALAFGDGDRGRRGIPRHVSAEHGVPQHMIPVRVSRPGDDGAQALHCKKIG
jgi:hypothetical protein